MQPKVVILTNNVWAVYRLNEDGTEAEEAIAEFSRPQNWGDPERWKYRVYTLDATVEGQAYRNVAHCWAELPITDADHLKLFSGLIATIILPSTPVEECANTHMKEDDFWADEWGPLPPFWTRDDDDWDEES